MQCFARTLRMQRRDDVWAPLPKELGAALLPERPRLQEARAAHCSARIPLHGPADHHTVSAVR